MLFSGHIVGRRCFWNGPHSSQGFRPLPLSIIWPSNFVYWNILKPSPQYSRFPLLNIFSHIQPTPHTFCSQGYVDHLIGLGLFHFIVSQGGEFLTAPPSFCQVLNPTPTFLEHVWHSSYVMLFYRSLCPSPFSNLHNPAPIPHGVLFGNYSFIFHHSQLKLYRHVQNDLAANNINFSKMGSKSFH